MQPKAIHHPSRRRHPEFILPRKHQSIAEITSIEAYIVLGLEFVRYYCCLNIVDDRFIYNSCSGCINLNFKKSLSVFLFF